MSLLNLNSKKLRIALKAYEPKLLDDSCRQIIESVNLDGSEVTGPVPYLLREEFIVYYVHLM